jgi:hypothetical protein
MTNRRALDALKLTKNSSNGKGFQRQPPAMALFPGQTQAPAFKKGRNP